VARCGCRHLDEGRRCFDIGHQRRGGRSAVAGRRSGGRPCPEPRGGTGVVGSPPAIGGWAGLWPDPLAGCGDRRIEGLAIGPHPLPRRVASLSMVARIGFSATTSRESRQGRKAAAAASMSGAGARAGASCLHFMEQGRRVSTTRGQALRSPQSNASSNGW
jgi:hypothetical protein